MEIGKRVPGIEPGFCRLRDLRLYRSLHEEVSHVLYLLLYIYSDVSRELISREFSRMNFEIILENEFSILEK